MEKKGVLKLESLKDQVYEYIRMQMQKGNIKQGSIINLETESKQLGISKTPLRDALLHLEFEGFVTVMPRKGVIVNVLTLEDIREYYQVIGSLESTALLCAASFFKKEHTNEMELLNKEMAKSLQKNNFDSYYKINLKFHNIFIDLCQNNHLKKTVHLLKKRLYDFPRPKKFLKEWEEGLILEHDKLVKLISDEKFLDASNFIRDIHWSFDVQREFVIKYYNILDGKAKIF